MNPNGKVQLVFANVYGNLLIILVSKNLDDIFVWNKKVNEYIVRVFDFAQMFLAFDGVILLFHPVDFKVFKEVKFDLESYGF
jgi:hypothetical protein